MKLNPLTCVLRHLTSDLRLLAIKSFILLRWARDWIRRFRHAGSIDQISGSDQDPIKGGRQKEECRMKKAEGLATGKSPEPADWKVCATNGASRGGARQLSISNWRFQISEGPGKDRR